MALRTLLKANTQASLRSLYRWFAKTLFQRSGDKLLNALMVETRRVMFYFLEERGNAWYFKDFLVRAFVKDCMLLAIAKMTTGTIAEMGPMLAAQGEAHAGLLDVLDAIVEERDAAQAVQAQTNAAQAQENVVLYKAVDTLLVEVGELKAAMATMQGQVLK